jgi:hypothetical protein
MLYELWMPKVEFFFRQLHLTWGIYVLVYCPKLLCFLCDFSNFNITVSFRTWCNLKAIGILEAPVGA